MDFEKIIAAVISGALALAPIVLNYLRGSSERLDAKRKEIVDDAHSEYDRKKKELTECESLVDQWRQKHAKVCEELADIRRYVTELEIASAKQEAVLREYKEHIEKDKEEQEKK